MKTHMIFITAVTGFALWMSWVWGLAMIHWPVSVLSGGDEPQASIIRRAMPHHLVKPEWITPMADGELVGPWLLAETKVRMAIISVAWLACVIGSWNWKQRRANHP